MDIKSTEYRNLADWTCKQWHAMDIHIFIAMNFTRYCSGLIKKVGLQYLPNDATDSLLGLFCDVAYKPLKAVHSKNLDAVGERRNQIMLGTLKMITFTRMVEALIREFPSYIALEQLPGSADEDSLCYFGEDDDSCPVVFALPDSNPSQFALYAAETSTLAYEFDDAEESGEDEQLSLMIETLRSHLTPVQYRHIRYAICDGLNSHEIANRTGHSVTNVRIMLLNARKKMMTLVPPHLLNSMQECLHRK